MPVTENLMAAGSFEVTLREDTPLSVRRAVPYVVNQFYPWGHIVITKEWLGVSTPSAAKVLSQARFTGRISRRKNQMHTFGGEGIAVWLGDTNGTGEPISTSGASKSFATWVHFMMNGTLGHGNGITEGSYSTTNTTAYFGQFSTDPYTTTRDVLDVLVGATGNNWKVTPQGVFHGGLPQYLFQSTPAVIVMRNIDGSPTEPQLAGFRATQLEVDEDFDEYFTQMDVVGSGGAGGTVGGLVLYSFDGATSVFMNAHQTSASSSGTACTALATQYFDQWSVSQRRIICKVDVQDPRRFVEPGDNIYVYDPDTSLTDPTGADAVNFRGRTVTPEILQLRGITYPISRGFGVYAIQTQDQSNIVTDLTNYVEWETGDTDLQIGALPIPISQVVTGVRKPF